MGMMTQAGYNGVDYLCASVVGMPVGTGEVVPYDDTVGGTKNTTALTLGRMYSFTPTTSVYLMFGDNTVTADSNGYWVPEGQERVFLATKQYVAAIRETTNGNLHIFPLDGCGEGAPA